jgi:hypothetical protein
MTEYSRMAKGTSTVLASGGIAPVKLPFQPDYVEFINYTAMATPTATWIAKGFWDKNMGQGFLASDFFDTGPVYSTKVASTGGISTFAAGLSLQYGAQFQIVSISKASPASIVATGHGLVSGDVVVLSGLYQSTTTGMQQIAGMPFTVTVSDANTFTIPWDTSGSNYTALSGSPAGAFARKVLYPYLYFPGANVISAISTGTTTTVSTTAAHNFVVGQEVAFHVPVSWGTYQLNTLPNTIIPGSPIYGYVVSVTDYHTVVVNINSTGYTAYNVNQPFLSFSGEFFPQIVAVGDVNTGGVQISAGSQLYPPPYLVPFGTTRVNTINGPAIQGAFVNNTSQGFLIGVGGAVAAQSGQTIYWKAYLHDLSVPV